MPYVVHRLWPSETWEAPDDEALWRWAQANLPSVFLTVPRGVDDLVRAISSRQNYAVQRNDPAGALVLPPVSAVLRAARLLREGRDLDDPAWRAAVVAHEDDPEAAALAACGAEPTEDNLAALRGVLAVTPARKHEPEAPAEPPAGTVAAGVPDGRETADLVRQALEQGQARALDLGNAKHSKGSWLLSPSGSDHDLFLKSGSGRQSPALGAREEPASQSAREGAFWHALKAFGLAGWAPRADQVKVGDRQYAAIEWLGSGWSPAGRVAKDRDVPLEHLLRPWLGDGTLHRLALVDYVLGNADRHSSNVLVHVDRLRTEHVERPFELIDHGSALAGYAFDPARDPNSFVPWYLRYWAAGWARLSPEERLAALPALAEPADRALRAWLDGVDEAALVEALVEHGVSTGPTLDRLRAARSEPGPLHAYVNRIWTVGR